MLPGEQDVLLKVLWLSCSGKCFLCVCVCKYIERERKEKHKHTDKHKFSVCSVNLRISIISNGSDIYVFIYSHMYIYSILIKIHYSWIRTWWTPHYIISLQNWLVTVWWVHTGKVRTPVKMHWVLAEFGAHSFKVTAIIPVSEIFMFQLLLV